MMSIIISKLGKIKNSLENQPQVKLLSPTAVQTSPESLSEKLSKVFSSADDFLDDCVAASAVVRPCHPSLQTWSESLIDDPLRLPGGSTFHSTQKYSSNHI
jgi:hypothetical protein